MHFAFFRALCAAAILAAIPLPALAYLDPGTGSMLVQSLLAAIAAGLVFGRTLWHRVKSFFTREPPKSPPREE